MMVSDTSPVKVQDIEKAETTPEKMCARCPWDRRTWRKIVIRSTATTNLASLATLVYGVVADNSWAAYAGAGSGLFFSAVGLFAHLLTYECKDRNQG
jgi:hypothetical protein